MFIQILQEYFVSNSGDPDWTPLSVAVSDLDLHCSSQVLYGLTRLISYTLDFNNCAI